MASVAINICLSIKVLYWLIRLSIVSKAMFLKSTESCIKIGNCVKCNIAKSNNINPLKFVPVPVSSIVKNVYFLGDSIFSEETISKYHVFFIYDVKEFLNTLEYLKTLEGKYYVPSHVEIKQDLKELIDINKNKINEISNAIIEICNSEKTFEEILKEILDKYNLTINENQYVLVGSTVKSYLSYLYESEKLEYIFKYNKMLWKIK